MQVPGFVSSTSTMTNCRGTRQKGKRCKCSKFKRPKGHSRNRETRGKCTDCAHDEADHVSSDPEDERPTASTSLLASLPKSSAIQKILETHGLDRLQGSRKTSDGQVSSVKVSAAKAAAREVSKVPYDVEGISGGRSSSQYRVGLGHRCT